MKARDNWDFQGRVYTLAELEAMDSRELENLTKSVNLAKKDSEFYLRAHGDTMPREQYVRKTGYHMFLETFAYHVENQVRKNRANRNDAFVMAATKYLDQDEVLDIWDDAEELIRSWAN